MAEIKQIAISDIGVVDRLRPIDEEHAKAIYVSVQEIGLINPITVRWTPAAKTGKYTLVAGGHRLRACELCAFETISAIVVEADKDEAQLIEIQENFFRNDLSVIDRSLFGERLREMWEDRSGLAINSAGGRPPKNRANLAQFFDESLSDFVTKRLGISKSGAKRLNRIANNLHPRLREQLRSTKWADNGSRLLSLSRMERDQQAITADHMASGLDLDAALKLVLPEKGRMKTPEWQENHLVEHLDRMPEELRNAALDRYGYIRKPVESLNTKLPEIRPVTPPGNVSPLRDMLRDPYARLSRKLTYEQVMKLKAQYEEEARELERYRKGVQANIEEQEKARQETFAAERERAEAKKARAMLKRTGTYKDLPAREKEMLAELDSSLQQALDDSMGRRHADLVRACHALDGARQVAMADVLYRGCDKGLAKEYAALLLADQRAKPRGAGRREVTMPLLVARKGPEKGILPHLWKRVKAMRGVLGMQTGFLKALTPERQSFVCDLLNRNISEDHILLYARKLSSGEGNRRKFRDAVITGDIAPEEIPEWLNQIDFEPPSKPVERYFERT